MKTPRFLVGAALVFWGWQTHLLIAGVVMAVVLEGARFIKARWELSNEDFSRVWMFCTLLFLATGVYAFTAGSGPAAISEFAANRSFSAQTAVGNATTKTAVLAIRWLPMSFFLFVAAQVYSEREGIPLEAISQILRRRWKKAREAGLPTPKSRNVDSGYPYFIACLFAAGSHATAENNGYYWGLCGLLVWALWAQRSRRFGIMIWAVTMGLAILAGYEGQYGLARLRTAIDQYSPDWLGKMAHEGFNPLESRTEIGQIGRIKTSRMIVIRLEVPPGSSPPTYLREAAYRNYRSGVWSAGSSKEDFTLVTEVPVESGNWPLVPRKTNSETVNIACYLPGGKGLLPLPPTSGLLEELPVFGVQTNSVGTVRAEGPGLVIFNARFGPGAIIDQGPDTNEDLGVPDREKPALDQVIAELHLDGQSAEQKQQNILRFFETKFAYSLWQDAPKDKDTNYTALGRFLLNTRSGHCEYFATATVLLLRELGIPARYTVGYAVHENSGSKYVVRQNDAHAWCRVWNVQKKQWEDFDTTPGTWVAMEGQQRSAFQFLSDGWSRAMFEFSKFRWGQSNLRKYILWAMVPVLGLLLYQIVFRSGKKRRQQNTTVRADDILRRGLDSEFFQLERELARRGYVRQAGEPSSVWLRRLAGEARFSGVRESLPPMIALHYRHRFDPLGLDAAERESLRREVARCLSLLTQHQGAGAMPTK